MENKTGIWNKAVRFVRRVYHTLDNYKTETKDIDFRNFGTLEYNDVSLEEVKDLKRLKYIKRLDLARKGFIDSDLKNLLSQGEAKENLTRHDHKMVPIGRFKVLESENLLGLVRLGFEPNTKNFFMASNDHCNIPLWKPYDGLRLQSQLGALHPVNHDTLQFKHTFFEADGMPYEKEDSDIISAFYNETIQQSFRGNPYFKTSILLASEEILTDPNQYLGRQFNLPLSEGNPSIMTLTEATQRYLVFQSYLETAPKPESLYFSTREFKERFLDSKIELIARLKHNLRLGIHKGTLYVGTNEVTNGKIGLQWETYESRMQSNDLSAKAKFYLSKEIISKKNFVVEKDAIGLKNSMQTAYLKKHYATGEWHFAEVGKHKEELNFRPIDQKVLQHIQEKYTDSKNFEKVFRKMGNNTNEQTLKI